MLGMLLLGLLLLMLQGECTEVVYDVERRLHSRSCLRWKLAWQLLLLLLLLFVKSEESQFRLTVQGI